MDTTQYVEIFMEEAKEHVQSLNHSLLELEKKPDEISILGEIFRSAHTLKGMSATMGFEKMAELTHLMENVLAKLRSGEAKVTEAVMDTLFQCLDALEQMVQEIGDGNSDNINIEELLKALRELEQNQQVSATSEAVQEELIDAGPLEEPSDVLDSVDVEFNHYEKKLLGDAKEKGMNSYFLEIKISPSCLMKVARAFMVFRNIEEIGEIIKSNPTVQEIEDEKFENSFTLVIITKYVKEKVLQSLNTITEVTVSRMEELNLLNEQSLQNYEEEAVTEQQEQVTEKGKADTETSKKTKAIQTVRVDIERLDNLMNLVGELVINKTRLEQISQTNSTTELNETIEHIDLITSDLQSVVMKVRMVPLEHVFNRFPRMIRDLAKDLKKKVDLTIKGEDTELDRTVIDEIGDPLVHLLRNAVDHGIEMPEDRMAHGKPEEASVSLEAWYEGNNVVIEVRDDGKGIDSNVIKKKAIEKEIITAQEAEQMDENAIVNLIFNSGFSTAKAVTDISGRGVGLDAVRSKIDALNGSVALETQKDKGSKFTIKLPLTLAIIQALLVEVGTETYAIPLSSIDETTYVADHNIKRIQNREVMLLRGNTLPLIRLDQELDTPVKSEDKEEYYVVVVRKGEKQAGLIVDSLLGQQDIVIKSLGKLLRGTQGLSGATILGNGHVALILDIGTLI
ncbi:two-component system chemotaxis sensor kinase CheA [Desulfitispora alkaliphila]|uniref:chemotaxis protein CheW n=1 Tax=Desulfitispora alkaliphila TaxID=622674 RepID=UPI003D211297